MYISKSDIFYDKWSNLFFWYFCKKIVLFDHLTCYYICINILYNQFYYIVQFSIIFKYFLNGNTKEKKRHILIIKFCCKINFEILILKVQFSQPSYNSRSKLYFFARNLFVRLFTTRGTLSQRKRESKQFKSGNVQLDSSLPTLSGFNSRIFNHYCKMI